ncbi:uncharacterized protein DSM5745_10157 [Aspergillus mulundensis]|uniref:Amidohydrolase-related domain-containing protein n=1 Tax=Aspergillus mulundensis TaxID=1810919 RepID=A0A3D8QMI3_9EURO|nr:Uncharacterized protein DSM5745_10157 [Aspergillus mulundensis]RDW63046.1 Uncharacterized protein DSM5745_10157 [Aspergillus mulundensis]
MRTVPAKPWLPAPAPTLTFTNATLIDPEAAKTIPNCCIRVENGLIAEITTESPSTQTSTTINLRGLYVCPGLIDCHVHITATPGGTSLNDMFAASQTSLTLRSAYVAREMLLRGFTTARDTGGADASLRDAIAEGLIPGPRLFIAGKALSQTGGHGDPRPSYLHASGSDEAGGKCCGGHALARVCDGVPACLAAVRDELRQGADFIKIMVGGGVASPSDTLAMVQFTPEEIAAITRTAGYSGKYVTAHAYTAAAIRHAVENGVAGIEHGNFIDAETARFCASLGVSVTPTLVTYRGMATAPFKRFLDLDGRAKNEAVLEGGIGALRILRDAGVNMCFGSDLLGGLHGLQNGEFGIRAGVLGAEEILRSATVNGARVLGMEGRLGVIKQGAIADLLVLRRNPLEDIGVLDQIEENMVGLLKDGRVVMWKHGEGQAGGRLAVDELYDPCRVQQRDYM